MDWDDMRVFLGVARAGSLSGAAQGLRMDPATLSRRIAKLETAIGGALFLKSPQGYALTTIGTRLMTSAVAMERAALAGLSEMDDPGGSLRGTVRIGAPDGVANYVLPQVCAGLMTAHPGLEVQIVALPRVFNLSRREADLAIAVSPPTTGRLLVQKLCDYHLSLAAHPDYLSRQPAIDSLRDLSGHRFVGYIPDMIYDADLDFLSALGVQPTVSSNSAAVQVQLLNAGQGLGVVHDFARPAAPHLVQVLPKDIRFTRAFHLLRHRDEAGQARSDLLAQLVGQGVRTQVARLEAQNLDRLPPTRAG